MIERRIPIVRELERQVRRGGGGAAGDDRRGCDGASPRAAERNRSVSAGGRSVPAEFSR